MGVSTPAIMVMAAMAVTVDMAVTVAMVAMAVVTVRHRRFIFNSNSNSSSHNKPCNLHRSPKPIIGIIAGIRKGIIHTSKNAPRAGCRCLPNPLIKSG